MEAESSKKTIELGEIISAAWKRKWLIVIPVILVTAAAFGASYLITPEYESSVIIWLGNPVRLSDQLRRMVGDAGNVLGEERHRSEELRSLQNEVVSTPYIRQLVDNLKLDRNPALDGRVQKIRSGRPDLSPEQIKFDLIVNDLRDRIRVGFAGWEQVRISVSSTNAITARDIAQSLGEILMAEKTKQEMGSIRMSQDFTYEQLSRYEGDLQAKIDEKTTLEKRYFDVQLNDVVASDSNRKAIDAEITGINSEIEDKKTEERNLLAQLSSVPTNRLTLNESADLKGRKDAVDTQLNSVTNLMLRYRWSDPEVFKFKTRLFGLIADVTSQIRQLAMQQFDQYDQPIRSQIAQLLAVRTELDYLYSRVNSMKLSLAGLDQRINYFPEYQAQLEQLDREINAARELRDRFREQQEGSQISQALLRESRFQVIEPAKVPLAPVKPNRPKILVMGLALGLMLGAGAALLAELLDSTLRKIEDVEKHVGFPVVGIIPEISSLKKAPRL